VQLKFFQKIMNSTIFNGGTFLVLRDWRVKEEILLSILGVKTL